MELILDVADLWVDPIFCSAPLPSSTTGEGPSPSIASFPVVAQGLLSLFNVCILSLIPLVALQLDLYSPVSLHAKKIQDLLFLIQTGEQDFGDALSLH